MHFYNIKRAPFCRNQYLWLYKKGAPKPGVNSSYGPRLRIEALLKIVFYFLPIVTQVRITGVVITCGEDIAHGKTRQVHPSFDTKRKTFLLCLSRPDRNDA